MVANAPSTSRPLYEDHISESNGLSRMMRFWSLGICRSLSTVDSCNHRVALVLCDINRIEDLPLSASVQATVALI